MYHNRWYTVVDPDLQMGGRGGRGGEWRSSRPRENGGRSLQKNFFQLFSNLGASVWSKNKEEGGGADLPWICQELSQLQILLKEFFTYVNDPVWNQSYEHRYNNLIYIVLTCCLQGQPASFQEKYPQPSTTLLSAPVAEGDN